jgi:hypothetical protein
VVCISILGVCIRVCRLMFNYVCGREYKYVYTHICFNHISLYLILYIFFNPAVRLQILG